MRACLDGAGFGRVAFPGWPIFFALPLHVEMLACLAAVCSAARRNTLTERTIDERNNRFVHPEVGAAAGQKPEMTAIFRGQQRQMRIRPNGRMVEYTERDKGIVARLQKQRGHCDTVQEVLRGLRGVIVIGALKAE